MLVGFARTKSSADSISGLPAAPGRDAVAILSSGLPVEKKKFCAAAGWTLPSPSTAKAIVAAHADGFIVSPRIQFTCYHSIRERIIAGCNQRQRVVAVAAPVPGRSAHR